MNLFNEDEVLDEKFRKEIIEEIEGPENTRRKAESYKRYEIYRDRIKKYILANLLQEMDEATVNEMQSRVATVNMYKKMVQKKARVYKDSPIRVSITKDQDYLQSLVSLLNLNSTMKKVNKYVEAFRNCAVYAKPYLNHAVDGKWAQYLDVLAPHSFDVIEDMDNPQMPRAVILTHYKATTVVSSDNNPNNRTSTNLQSNFRDGDNKNQTIADSPNDKKKEYIWWTKKYHFTTNEKGQIQNTGDESGVDNPIGMLPFTFFSKDQDESFWSVGGEDMIDGCVLINTLLTDLYFIQKIQGMGLFYIFGANVPKTYKVGPNRAITMKVEEGEPTPQIGFASSNPPIDAHMKVVEQYIAFLLSTNDLGTSSVSGQLDASNATSGIHEIIQNSEPMTAIEDEQEQYKDKEQNILRAVNVYHVFIKI